MAFSLGNIFRKVVQNPAHAAQKNAPNLPERLPFFFSRIHQFPPKNLPIFPGKLFSN